MTGLQKGAVDGAKIYDLGHAAAELDRLTMQAAVMAPITRRLFEEAGIGPGMRVLDVGSGAGDVAILLADLVGPMGEVVGSDRAPEALKVARTRIDALGLSNVTFREGDPGEMAFDRPFDGCVGRYILMFLADPAVMLRALAHHVRPGGSVAFHEVDWDGARSVPPVPTFDQCRAWLSETWRRVGADPRMGMNLHRTFLAAGLPAPSLRLEAIIGGVGDDQQRLLITSEIVRSMVSAIERVGVATAAEVDADTLNDRLLDELRRSGGVIAGRSEIGAWCRL
jgi:ubiquinone/menaquinone biosynthesis C-methylase UbiE